MIRLFLCDIALLCEVLGSFYTAACSATEGVVAETDELPVINGVLTETADRDAHAVLVVHVEGNLWTIVLLEVLDELLRCRRQLKLLWLTAVAAECLDELFLRRLLMELDENRRGVTVQNRYTDALKSSDLR